MFHQIVHNDFPQVEIILSNAGIGPAVIKGYFVTIDGKPIVAMNKDIWTEVCKRLKIRHVRCGGKYYEAGGAIKQGDDEVIFTLITNLGHDPHLNFNLVHSQLERIQVQIEYESMYGDKFIEYLRLK